MAKLNGKNILFSPLVNVVKHEDNSKMPPIRDAIIAKGGNIAEDAEYGDVPNAIMDLPVGDSSYALVTDTSEAYQKNILSGAAPLANLKKIGGKSYKSENLLNPNKLTAPLTGDFVISNDGAGTITLWGTANSGTMGYNRIMNSTIELPEGGDCYISIDEPLPENLAIVVWADDNPEFSSEDGYWLYGDVTSVLLRGERYIGAIEICGADVCTGTSGTITTYATPIRLMLSKGEPKKYTPYFEGLRDTKVTAIKNNGANLIPPTYFTETKTVSGVTFTPRADKGIDVKGTSTAAWLACDIYRFLPFTQDISYSISGSVPTADICLMISLYDANKNTLKKDYITQPTTGKATTVFKTVIADCPKAALISVRLCIKTVGTTVSGTVYPMLNYGTTAVPYKPYREPIITAIPQAIQDLSDYGKDGTYIDLEKGLYINTYGNTVSNINGIMGDLKHLIEIEGGGSIEFINDKAKAVPSELEYIRRLT